MLTQATAVLSSRFGFPAFRPLQARAVVPAIQGEDVLAVLPTGGGKSLCYQVPALLADEPTLVVSPLIALMQDQVGRLHSLGIPAAMLGGDLSPDVMRSTVASMANGAVRLVYLSPERLTTFAQLLTQGGISIARLAVDEAHCVVEWGHDFRPAYQRIGAARHLLQHPPVTALTGTATPAVRQAIRESLGMRDSAASVIGSFDRPNLHFYVQPVKSNAERLARLVSRVRAARDPVIVYAPTRNLVEGLTHALVGMGVTAAPYHAGLRSEERQRCLEGFLGDLIPVVVATSAFGMGIDKPDVRLVVHWNAPASPEAYYQEAGRAGRAGEVSDCLVFSHPRDEEVPLRQLDVTFPDERLVEAIWRRPELGARQPIGVRTSIDRLAEELRPDRGPVDWSRVRRRRLEAERRIHAMRHYCTSRRCRRRLLLEWFGESSTACGGCDHCGPSPRLT